MKDRYCDHGCAHARRWRRKGTFAFDSFSHPETCVFSLFFMSGNSFALLFAYTIFIRARLSPFVFNDFAFYSNLKSVNSSPHFLEE